LEFQQSVETSLEQFPQDLVQMKLERCRLGHEAAAIKDAIRAGNQKLVFEI
jgi:hypothetical protein